MRMKVNSIHRNVPATKFSYVDESFAVENLHECLQKCDYLCNILPSTPSTVGLLSGNVLQSCKEKQTVLINVGRGDVVSEESLLKALDHKWIGGAILDVFEKEPLPKDSALWTHPQVTVTPHVSGFTTSNQVNSVNVCYQKCCVRNCMDFFENSLMILTVNSNRIILKYLLNSKLFAKGAIKHDATDLFVKLQ